MLSTAEATLSELLANTAEELDLPPKVRLLVEAEYHAIGAHMMEAGQADPYDWDVYPQGAVMLGTVVSPVTPSGQYDLDMVCRLDVHKDSITWKGLKEANGEVLADYVEQNRGRPGAPVSLTENRRSWTLGYGGGFHIDSLFAVPDPAPDVSPTGILLTDRKLARWMPSDPKAYAAWFKKQMELELQERLIRKSAELRKSVEVVPEWEVKTTLQQVVQILKRHRDYFFDGDEDNRTPSILITTLAARAYRGERDLFDAVMETAADMPKFIERSGREYRVTSPVSDENFADKWAEYPERAARFFGWLDAVSSELEETMKVKGLQRVTEKLAKSFGRGPVEAAAKRMGGSVRSVSESGRLGLASPTGLLSTTTGQPIPPKTFYGSDGR